MGGSVGALLRHGSAEAGAFHLGFVFAAVWGLSSSACGVVHCRC